MFSQLSLNLMLNERRTWTPLNTQESISPASKPASHFMSPGYFFENMRFSLSEKEIKYGYRGIITILCFYHFFRDFDWSVGKIILFLHLNKNPCAGIFDICLDFTLVDCVDNNELYIKL